MDIRCTHFDDMDKMELHECMMLRQAVFVVEQDCVYQDADILDTQSYHLQFRTEAGLVAYARILPKGTSYADYASIGRVVTAMSIRGEGLGKKLVQHAIQKCQGLFPEESIKISAQAHLEKFYSELGFRTVGETYLEDGIPHIAMILPI